MIYVTYSTSKYIYHTTNCAKVGENHERLDSVEQLDDRYPWRECNICQNAEDS